jgi:hypothetical protein
MTAPKVFLCEPSGLSSTQRRISDEWHTRLFEFGFDVDQLRSHGYKRDPWHGLLGRMRASDGVLVLGLKQLFVSSGTWRRGTDQETEIVATWTSSWLHVETGMALAAGIPVLVASESGVCEGVFARETWTRLLRGTAAEAPDPGVVEAWAMAVVTQAVSQLSASSNN